MTNQTHAMRQGTSPRRLEKASQTSIQQRQTHIAGRIGSGGRDRY